MKKRFLSIVLTLALVFTLMPGMTLSAAAAGGEAVWTASECEFCPAGGGANAKLVLTGVTSNDWNVPPESITIDLGNEFTNIESFEEASGEEYSYTLSMEPIDGEEYGYVEEFCFSFRVVNEQHIISEMEVRYNDGTDNCVTLNYLVPEADDEFVLKHDNGKIKQVKRPVVDRITIAEDGTATINGKTYKTDGTPNDENAPALDTLGLAYSYDATNGAKLTVNGVDGVGPVIQSNTNENAISSEVDLELVLNVDTIVKCNDDDECHKAIDVSGDLKITGKHNLTATSLGDVISAGKNITIDVDNLTAVAKGDEGSGIIAENTLSILGDTSLEVSGIEWGLMVMGDLVLNHTGTVRVCGGIAVTVYNSVTTTKTGGLLAYGTDTAFETHNVDGMPEMLGSDVMWTAQNQVEPATPIHWCGHQAPEDPHKIAFVMVDSNPALAKTVKLGAVAPAPSGGYDPTYSITAPADTEHGAVTLNKKSASSGETVTITVTPDKGYTLETLTVLDKNGKEVEVKNLGNNKYTFKMPSGKVTVSATFMEDNSMLNFFVDVYANDYYYDAVLWAAENGITDGVDAVHFAPNGSTTRAQVVTFLWRAAGCPEPKSMNSFADVAADTYYAKAVAWAIEQGITKGTSATTFSPNSICTRAQIAAFMARYAGVADADCQTGFTDVPVNAYYASAVAWMLDNGVTEGTTATTYSPDADCTRAQIVTFLYRWMVK